MIGYHYTTRENSRTILRTGLKPAPLSPEKLRSFSFMLPIIKDGVIWLYKDRLVGDELLGMIIYVATNHCCSEICCLRVKYDDSESATMLLEQDYISVKLTHTLGAGHCGHQNLLIDLAITPVPSKNIELVDQWNLCDAIQKRKKRWF